MSNQYEHETEPQRPPPQHQAHPAPEADAALAAVPAADRAAAAELGAGASDRADAVSPQHQQLDAMLRTAQKALPINQRGAFAAFVVQSFEDAAALQELEAAAHAATESASALFAAGAPPELKPFEDAATKLAAALLRTKQMRLLRQQKANG